MAFVTVNLAAEYFWLSLDKKAADMPKTLSLGQYGITHGLPRLLDILDEVNVKATFFVPGKVAENYPEAITETASRGHEIACHGYEYENFSLLDGEEQNLRIGKAVVAIEAACGQKPRGFRAPMGDLTLETLRIAREHSMVYSSDLYDDDRPYFMKVDEEGNRMLQVPMQWANFDLPYFAFNYRPAFPFGQGRVANYSQVLSNWKDEFTGHYMQGLCYTLQLDPQTTGSPGRTELVGEFLHYMAEHEGVWFATGSDIYEYCADMEKRTDIKN
ncbi:MAG: polysaccharide deacetylase [Lachnospiraceae bacterium]|nr:polysaccharide deacetylase [Lachnospiraceae bacterium]